MLWTDALLLTASNDGDRIRCVATVPGLASNCTDVAVEVHCEYRSRSRSTILFNCVSLCLFILRDKLTRLEQSRLQLYFADFCFNCLCCKKLCPNTKHNTFRGVSTKKRKGTPPSISVQLRTCLWMLLDRNYKKYS